MYASTEGWLEQLEAMIRALFAAIAERPDAARLICVEMGASGEAGVQRWAEGAARFERFITRGFEQAPGAGTIPDPVARAIVGALRKIIYSRVRAERSSKALKLELMRLVPELMSWIAAYYPTPAGVPRHVLARKPRRLEGGRAPGSFSPPTPWAVRGLRRAQPPRRGLIVFNQRERIFDAIARLTASGGYQALSLEDIAAAAAVSLQTFYSHFENKEEAFLATYEVGHSRAKAAVNRALATQTEWIQRGPRRGPSAAGVPGLRACARTPGVCGHHDRLPPRRGSRGGGQRHLHPAARPGPSRRLTRERLPAVRQRGDRRRHLRAAPRLHSARPDPPPTGAGRPRQLHRPNPLHREPGSRPPR